MNRELGRRRSCSVELLGTGPIAAGNTARWINSGTGDTQRTHTLVKSTRLDIVTSFVINTDRPTYPLELRAHPSVYTASAPWRYPEDGLTIIGGGFSTPPVSRPSSISASNCSRVES